MKQFIFDIIIEPIRFWYFYIKTGRPIESKLKSKYGIAIKKQLKNKSFLDNIRDNK